MAFSEFTYPEVVTKFDLREKTGSLFPLARPVLPSAELAKSLPSFIKLATSNRTEKALSEWMAAPVLKEIWDHFNGKINLFSGTEFSADPENKLSGYCDFLIGRGDQIPRITAPLLVVVEAKRDNISNGLGQCIAGMIGIQRFNVREGFIDPLVYGCITTGSIWKLLKLHGQVLTYDDNEYSLVPIENLLGVLVAMIDTLLAAYPP